MCWFIYTNIVLIFICSLLAVLSDNEPPHMGTLHPTIAHYKPGKQICMQSHDLLRKGLPQPQPALA